MVEAVKEHGQPANCWQEPPLTKANTFNHFPEFGPERMGAPVTAFTRISTEPIRLHCAIYDPDVVVVLDNTLLKSVPVTAGLNDDEDVLIINSPEEPTVLKENLKVTKGKVWTVPATEIAIKILGAPITNTALLGCVAKATRHSHFRGHTENVEGTFQSRFSGEKLRNYQGSL